MFKVIKLKNFIVTLQRQLLKRYASLGADSVVNYTNNKASAEMTVSSIQNMVPKH